MKSILRLLSILLLLALLLSAVSCAAKIEYERVPLKLVSEDCVYSEGFDDLLVSRIERIARKLYPDVDEADLASLDSAIRNELLPVCAEIPVYEEELLSLLSLAEDYADSKRNADDIFLLYSRACTLLSSRRCGRIAHESLLFWVRYELSLPELDESLAEARREQLALLEEEIEKEGFEEVLGAIALLGNMFSGGLSVYIEKGVLISDNELILVIREYFEHLAAAELPRESWHAAGKLISGFLPPSDNVAESGVLENIFSAFPELIDFLLCSVRKLDLLDLAMIRLGSRSVYSVVFCEESRDAFAALDAYLRSCSLDPEPLRELIRDEGLYAAFEKFCQNLSPMGADEFFTLISTHNDNSLPRAALVRYLCSLSPELAFMVQTLATIDDTKK